MIEELERLTREYYEGEDEPHTVLDYIAAKVEDGVTLKSQAFELGQSLGFEVGRERISAYLRSTFGAEAVTAKLADARSHASHQMAEHAIELVDAPAEDSVEVARAASRARVRQWTAERYNARELGGQKGVSVSVTVGSLHLDALRHLSTIVTPASQPALASPAHNSDELAQVIE
jgi:hypothetical protein